MCLQTADEALKILQRSPYRLSVYQLRILASVHLQMPVDADIAKFSEKGEEKMAALWHMVAMVMPEEQKCLAALQNGVDVLVAPASRWKKIDLLFEMVDVLGSSGENVEQMLEQIESILMNLESETGEVEVSGVSTTDEPEKIVGQDTSQQTRSIIGNAVQKK